MEKVEKIEKLMCSFDENGIKGISEKNLPLAKLIYKELCVRNYTLQEAREMLTEVNNSFELEMNFRL